MDDTYGPLRVLVDHGVATVTIDHPPTNLVDGTFIGGLIGLLDACDAGDSGVRVLAFTSADPDFFLMHGDVESLLATPGSTDPVSAPNLAALTFDRLRTSRVVTIAAIDGAARGGGAEFCSAVDLRYGTPRTVLGQPEVPMGILPGAGGTARLPRLVGRSRALDLILTGRDVTADEALAIGWLDAVVPSASLVEHVAGVARRIAAMPRGVAGRGEAGRGRLARRDPPRRVGGRERRPRPAHGDRRPPGADDPLPRRGRPDPRRRGGSVGGDRRRPLQGPGE